MMCATHIVPANIASLRQELPLHHWCIARQGDGSSVLLYLCLFQDRGTVLLSLVKRVCLHAEAPPLLGEALKGKSAVKPYRKKLFHIFLHCPVIQYFGAGFCIVIGGNAPVLQHKEYRITESAVILFGKRFRRRVLDLL